MTKYQPILLRWLIPMLALFSFGMATQAEAIQVGASIQPVHSLVAGVMQGVGKPRLLIPSGQSPHLFSLRPSDVRKLNDAELIFWVGDDLEPPLKHILATNTGRAQIVKLIDLPGMLQLPVREGGVWQNHTHLNKNPQIETNHLHGVDHHIWLSPRNARRIVQAAQDNLSKQDPEHAPIYQKNAGVLLARLEKLDQTIRQNTSTVREVPYVVFHDAYQYFERHYDLNGVGSVTVSPEKSPGVKRVVELRKLIKQLGARCVFSEPQFEPKLLNTLIEGSSAHTGVLDPMGSNLTSGPNFYFELMSNLANSLVNCLSKKYTEPEANEIPQH